MSSWGQGGTRNWRRVRQQVLDRDRYECQVRSPGCAGVALEVHHVHGKAPGRRDTEPLEVLVAICRPCHRAITDRQKRAGQLRAQALRNARLRLPRGAHPGEL